VCVREIESVGVGVRGRGTAPCASPSGVRVWRLGSWGLEVGGWCLGVGVGVWELGFAGWGLEVGVGGWGLWFGGWGLGFGVGVWGVFGVWG